MRILFGGFVMRILLEDLVRRILFGGSCLEDLVSEDLVRRILL